ncbi:glycoside hydrolase family 38 protein [Peniophora sp. CONT]|nr:glycoside hydrolase family 38 protein [Peniophora sp. CONT]
MSCAHNHGHGHGQTPYPVENLKVGNKWIKSLTQNRLGTFTGGFFADVNLYAKLYALRTDASSAVNMTVWSAPGLTKPSFSEAIKQSYRSVHKGESFGPSWTNHWFKISLNVPEEFDKYEQVQFEFDPGCEGMVFTSDGTPLQGLTGGDGGDRRVEWILPKEARKSRKVDIVIEVSCNGMFGVPWNGDTIMPPDNNRYFTLASAEIVAPNMDAWNLMLDFDALKQFADSVPGNTPLQNKAVVVANEIMNIFRTGDEESILKARKKAEEVFGEGWEAKGAGVYDEGAKEAQIVGIGHCHIDTAWLWPYRVTQQKVARSWATQVDLMDRYPEHRFACSQAQQYKWLEQLYPPLYEKVKEKVLDGRFHPIGGSWVENDANMPSGEALVRQFTFGQRYFESRFGQRCRTAWLPDTFGLSGALPQLIRGAGMDYFFTQKLSWNNINTFPHSTFNWVGIDGTQVLCHMTPVDTYTAQATVGDITKGLTNHKNLESHSGALLVFGNGDGGGGPLSKMLENLRRVRAASNHSRDIPPVSMGSSVDEFFSGVRETSKGGETLPNWHGELYLEFHRGTYTSHGSIKKGNRKSEILMRDVELLATAASIHKPDEYTYPWTRIGDNWEKVLLNQFHDVLPGSAIGMVYDDAEVLYAEVAKDAHDLIEGAFRILLPNSIPLLPTNANQLTRSAQLIGYNTTPFARRELVTVPLEGNAKALGGSVVQVSRDGKEGYALMSADEGSNVAVPGVLPAGFGTVSASSSGPEHCVLRGPAVQLTINDGRITSLYDVKLGRELIHAGESGGLVIFEDRPNYWDAWDVEIHHLEKRTELRFGNVRVVSEGGVRAAVQTEVKYGNSTILVTISLGALPTTLESNSRPSFTFNAQVDWHERHEFLKFELPLDIHNDFATYETQFGHVQRPTHGNTTWDMAKFEVCGHKYADLSEFGYGVAILSESKYGFSCRGNMLRISLLRAATAPDAEQDQGKHEFGWAVMPHEGGFLESDVPRAAYVFNSPLHMRFVPDANDVEEPLRMTHRKPIEVKGARNVVLETIKRGDLDEQKGVRTVVLRLYESFGGHARADLVVRGLDVKSAHLTNLLEDLDESAESVELLRSGSGETGLRLAFRGFEVKTVVLVLGDGESEKVDVNEDTVKEKAHGKKDSWVDVAA